MTKVSEGPVRDRMVDAARRLIAHKQESFTIQELVGEADVALQTFYRQFDGKDQLLLAVLEAMIAEQAEQLEEAARALPDPVARLRFHVTTTIGVLASPDLDRSGPRFVTSAHWRLHQLFPDEVARATQPFADLLAREIREACASGLLAASDAERDAWLMTQLVMAVFHNHSFATADPGAAEIAEHLWSFCVGGLGGQPQSQHSGNGAG